MIRINKLGIKLETDRLFIKTLRVEDVTKEYVSGLNNKVINYYLTEVKRKRQTLKSIKAFVANNMISANNLLLGIFLKKSRRLIGTIRLTDISYFHYCLGIGICIFSKKHWGKGYGTEALVKVKDYVFENLKMHYIEAGVYSENVNSIRLFGKAGFELFIRVTDKYRFENRFADVLMFRCINQNFDFGLLER